MSLNYEKIRENEKEGSSWASYSDLFMVLSFVFLMLYVVSSIRTGTHSIQQHAQHKKVVAEAEDLREQLRVYNALKEDYRQKQASTKEQQVYNKLMSHLELLQDKTEQERQNLIAEAEKNKEKKYALNQYQQIIRNIINANMVSKGRLSSRNEIIESKSKIIANKSDIIKQKESELRDKYIEVEDLNKAISDKRQVIAQNTKKIAEFKDSLVLKVNKIKELYAQNLKTKKEMSNEIEKIEAQTNDAIDEIKSKNKEMSMQLSDSNKKLAAYSVEKEQLTKDMSRLESSLEGVTVEKDALKGKVKELENLAFAREKLASAIEKSLSDKGVDVAVNKKTGEVIINFKDYFDTGKNSLKNSMIEELRKFIPAYSKGLLGNKQYSSKVKNVEIIGFASPTYKGKYIDPTSLKPADKSAVSYNLDLSFYRAKSIFNYIFDKSKISYPYQKELLSIVKVTGRSFLAEEVKGRNLASGISRKEYCKKYNCKKSQKVIIKFNLQ